MMELIQHLLENPEALVKFKEGATEMFNISEEERQSIIDSLNGGISKTMGYWV